MEIIKFFYKSKYVGEGPLPPENTGADRHRVAKDNGVSIYDRVQFVSESGEIRMDSEDPDIKKVMTKEFNVEL